MNSYDQALYEGEAPGNLGFTSILPGNGKWFLRQVFNGRGWHQPDGNYHARCWLNIYGFDEGAGFRFDDGGCVCQTRYLCSSNQITKGWLTYAPTSTPEDPTMMPTMLVPTIPPAGMKTREPTMMPVAKTLEPTMVEMSEPTADPSTKPTAKPTAEPTEKPTSAPVTPAPSVAKTADPTTKPTMPPTTKKTAKPTAKPTASPTEKPTSAPVTKPTAEPTEKPTSAPVTPAPSTAGPCEDSTSWIQGTKAGRTCAWIGKNAAKRCTKESADKVPASVACRAACGSCGEADSFPSLPAPDCVDSRTWRGAKKGQANPKQTCAWVAQQAKKRCKRKDVDKVKAKVACPVACGTCD